MTDNLPATVPRANTLEALAQAHEVEALSLLIDTLRNTDVKIEHRLKAAESVLERARGKPRQPVAKDPNGQRKTKAVSMSMDTLLGIVEKAQARVKHQDATRVQAQILEGEFVPAPRKRPVNEYAIQNKPPVSDKQNTPNVDDLLR